MGVLNKSTHKQLCGGWGVWVCGVWGGLGVWWAGVTNVKEPKVTEQQQRRSFPQTSLSFHAHFPLSAFYFHSIRANIFPTSLILHLIAFAFKLPSTHTHFPPSAFSLVAALPPVAHPVLSAVFHDG